MTMTIGPVLDVGYLKPISPDRTLMEFEYYFEKKIIDDPSPDARVGYAHHPIHLFTVLVLLY
jgi:hypothetical protein